MRKADLFAALWFGAGALMILHIAARVGWGVASDHWTWWVAMVVILTVSCMNSIEYFANV